MLAAECEVVPHELGPGPLSLLQSDGLLRLRVEAEEEVNGGGACGSDTDAMSVRGKFGSAKAAAQIMPRRLEILIGVA